MNALFQILNVEQGLEIIITTNGSVCSGELIELLKSINLKQLKISLHSLEPRTFSKFTGTVGQFGNVLRNIRKFAHIFNVGINITLTKSNYPELDRVIFFCKNEGVKSLHISQLTPSGQGTQIRAEKLSNDQIKEVADRLGKSSNDDLSISYDSHSSCGFGQKLVVGPSGDLYPCVALVSYPEYRIGDIYSTGIKLQRRINKFNEIRSKRCFVEEFIR